MHFLLILMKNAKKVYRTSAQIIFSFVDRLLFSLPVPLSQHMQDSGWALVFSLYIMQFLFSFAIWEGVYVSPYFILVVSL